MLFQHTPYLLLFSLKPIITITVENNNNNKYNNDREAEACTFRSLRYGSPTYSNIITVLLISTMDVNQLHYADRLFLCVAECFRVCKEENV